MDSPQDGYYYSIYLIGIANPVPVLDTYECLNGLRMTCENHKWFPRPNAYFRGGRLNVFLECAKCGLEIFIEKCISEHEIRSAIKDAASE